MLSRRVFAGALAAMAASASELKDQNYPVRRRQKVEPLFKSPDGNPNGLEATLDGLWIGEQVTDRAYLVDWNGKVIKKFETQSSNTSGIAAGGGFVWMAANGPSGVRPKRPHDLEKGGRICKIDINTGQSVKNYPTPNGGGLHGLLWALDSLWVTQFGPNMILQSDADLNIKHSFPAPLNRAHGLGWDGEHLWCMFSNDYRILKFDVKDGKVLEAVQLDSTDPDPHGMTWWNGHLYYCDAGIAPGSVATKSQYSGYVCRIDF